MVSMPGRVTISAVHRDLRKILAAARGCWGAFGEGEFKGGKRRFIEVVSPIRFNPS